MVLVHLERQLVKPTPARQMDRPEGMSSVLRANDVARERTRPVALLRKWCTWSSLHARLQRQIGVSLADDH